MFVDVMNFLKKYKKIILYIVFGALTTLVNFVAFWLIGRALGEKLYLVSNAIAWVIAVVFAFVTNKLIVFESRSTEKSTVVRELAEFFGARLLSLGVEEGGLLLLVGVLGFGDWSLGILGFDISGQMVAKVILAVVVVILNYFFSELIIFKSKE